MWTHEVPRATDWQGESWRWRQQKVDGHRLTIFCQDDGRLVAFGRDRRPHLEMNERLSCLQWFRNLDLPSHSSLDGELYAPDRPASAVKTAIIDGTAKFVAFAIPWWDGASWKDFDLVVVQMFARERGIPFLFVERRMGVDVTKEALAESALRAGYEGWVLKNGHYDEWYKVKRVQTVDCVVTGFVDGEGKYLGNTGAIRASVWRDGELVEIARVSGMSDDVRDMIDERADLGRVVEVAYQELGSRGRLRHPRFVRWRNDKPAKECILDVVAG